MKQKKKKNNRKRQTRKYESAAVRGYDDLFDEVALQLKARGMELVRTEKDRRILADLVNEIIVITKTLIQHGYKKY